MENDTQFNALNCSEISRKKSCKKFSFINARFAAFVALVCLSFVILSCQKTSGTSQEQNFVFEDEKTGFLPVPASVLVFYGYDFNEPEFVADCNSFLFEHYGSYEQGGAVFPVVFPDDFKQGSRTRISLIKNFISENNFAGIILLGAPEGTGEVLSDVIDKNDFGKPIISFFPQDELLPAEYSSDFIVGLPEEQTKPNVENIFNLTGKAIEACLQNQFKQNASLKGFVKDLVGSDFMVYNFTDSQTAIIVKNHFVIESILPPRSGTVQ